MTTAQRYAVKVGHLRLISDRDRFYKELGDIKESVKFENDEMKELVNLSLCEAMAQRLCN